MNLYTLFALCTVGTAVSVENQIRAHLKDGVTYSDDTIHQIVDNSFRTYDKSGDGYLNKEEVRDLATRGGYIGIDFNMDTFDDDFKEMDADGSNLITKDELFTYLRRHTN